MPIQIVSSEHAFVTGKDKATMWPKTPEERARRLNPMCLPRINPSFSISKEDTIFTIGSCFARNIERQLIVEGFNVAARHFPSLCDETGVKIPSEAMNKFVAGSILNEIRWALDPATSFDERSIVPVRENRYIDTQLAVSLLPAPLELVRAVRHAVSKYMSYLRDAKIIIMTLGLAEGWYDKETKLYMNTPPHRGTIKLFPDRFELHVLSYEDIVSALEDIIDCLRKHGHPDFRMLLTVSPVALGSTWTDNDAMVANTYSKAVQRAAAGYITTKYDFIDYLPSYESVTLSDRRIAWREDGAHASEEVVRINVRRMLEAYSGIISEDDADQRRAAALQLAREAVAEKNEGRLTEALRLLTKAKELAPDEVVVCTRRGRLLSRLGRHEEAVIELAHARKFGGDQYGAAAMLGAALLHLDRPAEAISPLEDCVTLDLKLSKGAAFSLAKAYHRVDRTEEALKLLLDRVLPEADIKHYAAHLAARLLIKLGQYAEAATMAELALAEQPAREQYLATKAQANGYLVGAQVSPAS